MTLLVAARRRALAAVLTAASLSSAALAGPILGTAKLTDGSDGTFAKMYTADRSPVSISRFADVPGTSTLLGQVVVKGTSDGYFNLGAQGQATHEHESRFQFSETVTNTSGIAQALSAAFLLNAGKLMTTVFEAVPKGSEFLEAGYSISMSFAGAVVFQSRALLRQIGVFGTNTTRAIFTKFGTDLGGTLTHPMTGAPDRFLYEWSDYRGTLDLGVLDAGESARFEYDVRSYVRADFASCGGVGCGGTLSSIGDPMNFRSDPNDTSSIGGLHTFNFTPAVPAGAAAPRVAVPEPGTLGLLITGLLAIGAARRKRRV